MTTANTPETVRPVTETYWKAFLDRVPQGNLVEELERHSQAVLDQLDEVSDENLDYAYAPGKWTVRQLLGHLLDTHVVFVYRATCFSRGESQVLPGFDENAYTENWLTSRASAAQLIRAYARLSQSTVSLVSLMLPELWQRPGIANGTRLNGEQMLRILMGHERHHLGILSSRYGLG